MGWKGILLTQSKCFSRSHYSLMLWFFRHIFICVNVWKVFNIFHLNLIKITFWGCRFWLFSRVVRFTCVSRVWIFDSSSLIFSSFFWDSAWASCRALNSSSNCKRRETRMSACRQTRVEGGKGKRRVVSGECPEGASRGRESTLLHTLRPVSIHNPYSPRVPSPFVSCLDLGFHVCWWL